MSSGWSLSVFWFCKVTCKVTEKFLMLKKISWEIIVIYRVIASWNNLPGKLNCSWNAK
jgi:hypothetical protein